MSQWIEVGVCGAHMQGLPLNHQLVTLQATYVKTCKTAVGYRLFDVPEKVPPRPGLLKDRTSPYAIELEVWQMPLENFGAFMVQIASPLGIGTLELDDGSSVKGFICECDAVKNAKEISEYGGWKAYIAKAQHV